MRNVPVEEWVVYLRPIKGSPDGIRAVCEQREWQVMERAKPGYYTLIQAGIIHEGEAERLARGRSGEARARSAKRSMATWPGEVVAVVVGPEVAVSG